MDGDLLINIDAELAGADEKMSHLTSEVDKLGEHSKLADEGTQKLASGILKATEGIAHETTGIEHSTTAINEATHAHEKLASEAGHTGEKMHEAGGESEGLLGKLGGLAGAATGFAIVGGGAFEVTEMLGKAIEKATEAQASFATLDNTLKNNVPSWNGNKEEIEDYVNKQKLLGFSTEDINNSLGTLAITTHSVEEAQKDQGLAMDLARAKHIDLATATKIVDKADMDSVASLKKLGIEVDKNATKEQLLAAIHKATAGAAEDWSNTSAGASAKLGAVMDTLLEKVGGEVMPGITAAMSGVADFVSSPGFMGAIQGVMDGITQGFQFVGQAIQAVLPIIQPFISAIMGFYSSIAGGGDVLASLGTYFQNLGSAIGNAWNIVAPALGGLIQNIINWIQAHGPAILATLGTWAQAFGSWVWNSAIPWMLNALGNLITALWGWIQANGPGILNQLGVWAQAFGAWLWNTAIPAMLQGLGQLIAALWGWIQANGPGILTQLGTWAQQFGAWLWNTAIPAMLQGLGQLISQLWGWIQANGPGILQQLGVWANQFLAWVGSVAAQIPGWLGTVIGALWNWITSNGPGILNQLGVWANQFLAWVNSVKDQIPGWLGNIASALWTWLTTTAGDLGTKLTTQWLPAFWGWINGPDGVIAHLAAKMADIATGLWNWVTTTAGDMVTKVMAIGQGIIDGIKQGISNGWNAFVTWLGNLLDGLITAIKAQFGISSPSKVWAAEIGAPMADGIGVGFSTAWAGVAANLLAQLDGTWGAANERVKQIAAMAGGGNVGGTSGPNTYQGSYGGANNGQAGSGGSGAKTMMVGTTPAVFGGGGVVVPGGGGNVVLNLYLDGVATSAEQLSQRLGLRARLTAVRT